MCVWNCVEEINIIATGMQTNIEKKSTAITILSYNVCFKNDCIENIDKLVRYITNGRFDLVLLQEVADNIRLAGSGTVFGYLQKQLQSEYYFSGKTLLISKVYISVVGVKGPILTF